MSGEYSQFVFDPYQDIGPSPDVADDYSDADKLRLLADWFDAQDRMRGLTDDLVQRDLRRIANRLVGDEHEAVVRAAEDAEHDLADALRCRCSDGIRCSERATNDMFCDDCDG